MKVQVSKEQAEKEITSWLDKKKVFEETREKYSDQVQTLVEAMSHGALELNPETFEFTHKLLFALGEDGNEGIKELVYKARINDKMIKAHMNGVKNDDLDGRFNALLAALTSQSKAVISVLDSADKRIASAIGIFFM